MHEVEVDLDGAPSSVAVARRFIAGALAEAGARDEVWAAVQAVSELATNAVVHARTPFTVRVVIADDAVRLMVVDKQPFGPVSQAPMSPDTTTGRGLRLIEMLSREWGVERTSATKMVWCEIARAHPRAAPHDVENVSDADTSASDLTAARKPGAQGQTRAIARHRVA